MRLRLFVLVIFLSFAEAHASYVGTSGAKESAQIQTEWMVIIWDSSTHTEHLVWMIDFRTNARAVLLLVPTPSVPEIEPVDPAIFRMASEVTAPSIVPRRVPANVLGAAFVSFAGSLSLFRTIPETGEFGVPTSTIGSPSTPQDTMVATLLDPHDPVQVPTWLKQNGFGWNEDYREWLAHYALKRWKISAFKFEPGSSEIHHFVTPAFDLSFNTDTPFFPYKEFTDSYGVKPTVDGGRSLILTFLGDAPVTGFLEEGMAWPATLQYVGTAEPEPHFAPKWTCADWVHLSKLDGRVQEPLFASGFIDKSNPRPGTTDLVFSPAPDLAGFRRKITNPSIRPIIDFEAWDYLGVALSFVLPALFIYIGVRSWQNTSLLIRNSSSPSIGIGSTVPAWLQNMDSTAWLLCVILGFLFMASFAIFPVIFFWGALSLVKRPETIFVASQVRFYRICSLVMVLAAVIYWGVVLVNVLLPQATN